MKTSFTKRSAYTLIELLTVISIVAALAAISVTIAKSSVGDSYRSVSGADRVSGWLLIAKNRALRDKTPVGVRLIRDTSNPNLITSAQFIEMPTLWAPNLEPDGRILFNSNPAAPFVIVKYDQGAGGLRQEDNVQSAASNYGVFVFGVNLNSFDVQVGDLLRIQETNTLHRIEQIRQINTPAWYTSPGIGPALNSFPVGNRLCFKLTLAASTMQLRTGESYPASPPNPQRLLPVGTGAAPVPGGSAIYPIGYPAIGAANFYKSYFFAFLRSARPILGEPIVTMPTDMVVDATPTQATTPGTRNPSTGFASLNNTAANIDIIFAPNGQLLFTDSGMVTLLVRNSAKNAQTPFLETAAPSATTATFDRARMLAAGEMFYVAVYSKTGSISTYPIFMPNTTNQYNLTVGESPTKFARDAFNRGL